MELLLARQLCIFTSDSSSSQWMVPNEMDQNSFLGSVLFGIFMNDLDRKVEVMFIRFAEDLTLGWIIDTREGRNKIQNKLEGLEKCDESNKLKFKGDKHQFLQMHR